MVLSTKLFALFCCAILAVLVYELVRKKKIWEEYSLLWLGVTIVFAIFILFDKFTLKLIRFLGGVNMSSLFFFGGVFLSVLMLLHLTVRISELKRKQNVLIQESGLLREYVERLEQIISQNTNKDTTK